MAEAIQQRADEGRVAQSTVSFQPFFRNADMRRARISN